MGISTWEIFVFDCDWTAGCLLSSTYAIIRPSCTELWVNMTNNGVIASKYSGATELFLIHTRMCGITAVKMRLTMLTLPSGYVHDNYHFRSCDKLAMGRIPSYRRFEYKLKDARNYLEMLFTRSLRKCPKPICR